jgi:4-carboxymuconolactone decarboxylase
MRAPITCTIAILICAAAPALAQDRMPPIAADKLTEAQKKAIDEFRTARSAEISGPFVPLLRSPEVLGRARAMGDYLRYRSALPARLSEFVILMTARAWTQNYEWNAHEPLARQAGLNVAVIKAIADGRRPDAMAEDEEILFSFCDELRRNQGVSDATYARAVAKFGEQGVIDTVGIVGYYTMIAMVLNTARTPLPGGASPVLTPLPR